MAFEADSIRVLFGDKIILSDIQLRLDRGEIVGLIGRNGSGKTTLLKTLFGSLNPDQKFVRINGEVLKLPYTSGLVKYLNQDGYAPLNSRTIDLLNAFCPNKLHQKKILGYAKANPKSRLKDLSTGQRRLVELMCLLFSDAEYILLDEPFTGLSPITVDIVIDEIRLAARSGKSFIICDHLIDDLVRVCHRFLTLESGVLKSVVGDVDHF